MNTKILSDFIVDRSVYLGLFFLLYLYIYMHGNLFWISLISETTDFSLVYKCSFLAANLGPFVSALPLAYLDLIKPSTFMQAYRIQLDHQPTLNDYKKALPLVLLNIVIITPISGHCFYYIFHPISPLYLGNEIRTNRFERLPSALELLLDVIFCKLCEEVLFYYLHRLFHNRKFYAAIHKKHHEFAAPIGISAYYMEPLDFILTNVLPTVFGTILTQAHPITIFSYFFVTSISTIMTHSGYEISYFPWARRHDFHHETSNSTFGVLGLMDWIHGTDEKFQDRLKKIKHPRAYSTN